MYKEQKKCREATLNQLIKRKEILCEKMNELKNFVMGSITKNRYSKCGKSYCSCHDKIKPKLHGPYSDLSHRGGDKTGSIFLTEEKMHVAEKIVQDYADIREVMKEISCINLELFRRKEFQHLET